MRDVSRRVWLALGGNMGDRVHHLREAVRGLTAGGVAIDVVSSLYETPPWGVVDQPDFLNGAVSGVTRLDPYELLRLCKRIEAAAGRDFEAPRNSARPVDIDVLLIEGEEVSAPDLEVPHAAMHSRGFVLVPLAEVAAGEVHPRLGRSIEALRDALPASERAAIRRHLGPGWSDVSVGSPES